MDEYDWLNDKQYNRGLVLDLVNKKIVALPFPKFFNEGGENWDYLLYNFHGSKYHPQCQRGITIIPDDDINQIVEEFKVEYKPYIDILNDFCGVENVHIQYGVVEYYA